MKKIFYNPFQVIVFIKVANNWLITVNSQQKSIQNDFIVIMNVFFFVITLIWAQDWIRMTCDSWFTPGPKTLAPAIDKNNLQSVYANNYSVDCFCQ